MIDHTQPTEAQVQAAQDEEQQHLNDAIRTHLQQRVIMLNIENQALRARVADLEADVPDPAPESPLDTAWPLDPDPDPMLKDAAE